MLNVLLCRYFSGVCVCVCYVCMSRYIICTGSYTYYVYHLNIICFLFECIPHSKCIPIICQLHNVLKAVFSINSPVSAGTKAYYDLVDLLTNWFATSSIMSKGICLQLVSLYIYSPQLTKTEERNSWFIYEGAKSECIVGSDSFNSISCM